MSARHSHLSAQSLSTALKGLDTVIAEKKEIPEDSVPHRVPAPAALLDVVTVSDYFYVASPTGFEPVLPH
jgi:hypothetical protein